MNTIEEKDQVLIAIGSNLGDRSAYIKAALSRIIDLCGDIVATADFYETAPVGAADQMFLNSAIICKTSLPPQTLLESLLAIESELGRERLVHWGNRTIDLDIILWKAADGTMLVQEDQHLTIPHPRMLERLFVMIPAAQIAGHWIHLPSGKNLKEALQSLLSYSG
jgi:2-amino-4-hydroxy-6-hydroxymethyldihydropteridine diphosphokinase